MSIIEQIKSEWNADALLIKPDDLMRLCKEVASRQQREAMLLKQSHDCTPEKLFALYHRQRGRCALTGIPMTYLRGARIETSIEIDHVVEVLRGTSFTAVSAGGESAGGLSGMMSNLRFVCRLAHQIRHKLDGFCVDRKQLFARLYVGCEFGGPTNPDISLENPIGLLSSSCAIGEAVSRFIRSRAVAPSSKQVTRYISELGMLAQPHQIYRAIAEAGIHGRTDRQKSRVAAAVGMLSENDAFVLEISANRISVEMKNRLRELTEQFAEGDVTDTSLRDDLRIAYQLVTGREAPAVAASFSESNGYIKRKLKIWSKPCAALRSRVMECIRGFGRDGVAVDVVVSQITSGDSVAKHDACGRYSEMLGASVRIVVDELHSRRMIDVENGVATARLRTAEAASYCGYAGSYLKKCHKHGVGPACEMAAPGVGTCLTFSYIALDRWVTQRGASRGKQIQASLSSC